THTPAPLRTGSGLPITQWVSLRGWLRVLRLPPRGQSEGALVECRLSNGGKVPVWPRCNHRQRGRGDQRVAIAMWRPGRRLFSTAALLMILTAAAHTAGNLASGPEDPAERQVFAAMDGLRFPLGMGMNPSLRDVYWELVFTMSITFAAIGVINLVI